MAPGVGQQRRGHAGSRAGSAAGPRGELREACSRRSAGLASGRGVLCAPDQSEERRLVSGTQGGRETASPGVKLKLNPVMYQEVTGGRFRLPIRNYTSNYPGGGF